jgi:hypothetical protein
MSDPVADIVTNAHLAGLVEELQESCMRLRLESRGMRAGRPRSTCSNHPTYLVSQASVRPSASLWAASL